MKSLMNIFVLALLACSAMSVPIGKENAEQLMNEGQMEQMMNEQPQSEQLVQDKVSSVTCVTW